MIQWALQFKFIAKLSSLHPLVQAYMVADRLTWYARARSTYVGMRSMQPTSAQLLLMERIHYKWKWNNKYTQTSTYILHF